MHYLAFMYTMLSVEYTEFLPNLSVIKIWLTIISKNRKFIAFFFMSKKKIENLIYQNLLN